MKRKLKNLESDLHNAKTYQAWKEAAIEYDRLAGHNDWKEDDRSPYYDYELIRSRLKELREDRENRDVEKLVFNLHEGLHGNLGNIANPQLYAIARFGTKSLIMDYLDEVIECLVFLCDNEFPELPFPEKLAFFERTGQAFGRSALMLSGGATLGLFHLGVLKALYDEGLLPSILSGSSAGSIMAAVLGTHTDDELDALFDPESLYVEAFRLIGWKGILKGKPLMDGDYLEACLKKNVGDFTFEEAYRKTGRSINITVSPADPHQEARLLNARTAPNVLISKASLASCAIPGIYPAVKLWAKNIKGEQIPYIPSRRWVDGTLKNDLPIQRLSRLYGVNHTIVSQTNPHVVPFLSRSRQHPILLTMARKLIGKNITLNVGLVLEALTKNVRPNSLALLFDKAHSLVAQAYIGDINIVPPRRPTNMARIFLNANSKDVEEFINIGKQATWPKIEMIRNTTRISRTFTSCIHKLQQQERDQLFSLES